MEGELYAVPRASSPSQFGVTIDISSSMADVGDRVATLQAIVAQVTPPVDGRIHSPFRPPAPAPRCATRAPRTPTSRRSGRT